MSDKIGIIGKGGHADEVMSYSPKEIGFQAVDRAYIKNGDTETVDVASPGVAQDVPVHIAVGAPGVRKELEEKWPGATYESIISKYAYVDPSVEIGEGALIAPQAVVTTNVKLGRHTILNVACSVQHNAVIGDFTTIGPGSHLGGNVTTGKGVFIGIGVTVSNGITIANGVVVGAGATVVDNLEVENGVYVGVPAKLHGQNKEWLREI